MRFRWSSVDGRKRCKNVSVDEKLFIRFQETENGGFRKRISVERALITKSVMINPWAQLFESRLTSITD